MSTSRHSRISAFKTLAATEVAAIRAAASGSWQNLDLTQREERVVHDYFSGRNNAGLKHLNCTISPLFLKAGFELKFAGIFCHGQPQVTPFRRKTNDPSRTRICAPCELGDLHLVFVFLDQAKNLLDQRAILFQVKKKLRIGGASLIDNPRQASLYEEADSFDYSNVLKGSRNWPTYKEKERALHYLFCGTLPVITSSACANAPIDFGELLFRFLSDSEGVFFAEPIARYQGWWHVNWDLLKTVSKAYYGQSTRGEGVTEVLSHFNDFANHDNFFLDLGEDGHDGIPTLFVIVRDRQLPAEAHKFVAPHI